MTPDELLCPSGRPEMSGSKVLGVVRELDGVAFVHHLAEPQPVTPELLAIAAPARPTQVFRFSAPCAGSACDHFDGATCRLASKIVANVDDVAASIPQCRIRPTCRWFVQEGTAACRRCPLIFSETAAPSPALAYAADPTS